MNDDLIDIAGVTICLPESVYDRAPVRTRKRSMRLYKRLKQLVEQDNEIKRLARELGFHLEITTYNEFNNQRCIYEQIV